MAGIRLKALTKSYGTVQVIAGLDLEIHDREFIVFVGPSGCGKSTLLRIIAGLEPIDSGEIHIGDRLVNDMPPAQRDIAMVFQDYALYPHMSVYDNMAFGLEMRDTPRAEIDRRVREAAGLLHIADYLDRKPKALSGGQRQRVAMGRAMVREPQVFLFDEPLSNLDAKLRGEVRTEIKALAQQLQTTMVFVTHDQVEAMTMADRIVVLKGGVIQQIGTPQQVYNAPVNQFVAGFIGAPTMNFFAARWTGDALSIADGCRLPLDEGRVSRLRALAAEQGAAAAHTAKPLLLGVRPEHLRLLPAAVPDGDSPRQAAAGGPAPSLNAVVSVVEPLGSDTLVYFEFDGQRRVARVAPQATPRAGDTVRFEVLIEQAHLFDAASGVALR